jgi:hypothetical protein
MTEELSKLTELERIVNPLETVTLGTDIDALDQAVSNARGILAKMKEYVKTCETAYKEQMLEIVRERGAFVLHGTKYFEGVKKTQRMADNKDILLAVSKASNKDPEKIINCLKKGAWKAGECKKLLGKDTPLFWSEEDPELKVSELKSVDTRFLNQGEK